MTERRSGIRQRVLKGGTIVLPSGGAITCMVRNVSETGAAIEVESSIAIPDTFDLLIGDGQERRHHCKVAWRTARRLGVAFT